MTLIDYHNQFWLMDEEKHFTQAETRLYFYLLYLWNSTGRKEWFECKTSMIEHYADINPMTLTRCRKSLKDRKLLDFKQGSAKGKYPYYCLRNVKDDVKVNVKVDVNDNVKDMLNHIEYRDIEKETSSNEEVKKAKLPSPTSERMDWGAFMQTFNDMLAPAIPKIQTMSESRRQKVKAIVKEFGKESIMKVFEHVRNSDFLMGHNKSGWHCDFDWIFKKNNYIKILEGNYDNGVNQANHSEKRAINAQVFADFLADREQRASGMAYEVERPF